ncbi:AfsA-related hotdog domain-containing protein [Amycolatopsis sp. CA-126428]|uniref:AfsA-related hotdog domain-containing protein n=1 Tax=Amycolatopsis sp. CA-126428 TaxID=2073158 RepID=UPI000CD299C7|nr:AfsA-related hotdog domain-containing protein [Amycolatopsis sp. CA-126428]
MKTAGVAERAAAAVDWPACTPEKLGLRTGPAVDRRLAHKESDDEVFITDVGRRRGMLTAAGAVPPAHRYFGDRAAAGPDALHLAEFVRQGIEVIAHALLDVPVTHHFVLRTVRIRTTGPAMAGHAVIAFPETQVRRNSSGAVYAATGPVHCVIGGQPIARCDGLVGFLSPDAYRAVRGENGRPGTPAGSVDPNPPHTVGRRFPENVFIGAVEGPPRSARCRVVPRTHPVFFDRPLDHYPGMLIADAARQLATLSFAASAGVPAGRVRTGHADLEFTSFAELGTPPVLEIGSWSGAGSDTEITVESRQGTRLTATCRFRVSADLADGGRS